MEKVKSYACRWAEAAGMRALKTAAQTTIAMISTGQILGDIDWVYVASAVALATVLSVLTSVVGLPEVDKDGDGLADDTPVTATKKEDKNA